MTTIHLEPDYLLVPVRPGFKVKIRSRGKEEWIEYVYYRRETEEEYRKRKNLPPPIVLTPKELAAAEEHRKAFNNVLSGCRVVKQGNLISEMIVVQPMPAPSGILFYLDYTFKSKKEK